MQFGRKQIVVWQTLLATVLVLWASSAVPAQRPAVKLLIPRKTSKIVRPQTIRLPHSRNAPIDAYNFRKLSPDSYIVFREDQSKFTKLFSEQGYVTEDALHSAAGSTSSRYFELSNWPNSSLDSNLVRPRGPPNWLRSIQGYDFAPFDDELVTVSQLYIKDTKLPFPIDQRFALRSKPTLGNRIIDGIASDTTWVIPQSKNNVGWFSRLMTGRPGRTGIVEFKVRKSELVRPRGLKRPFTKYQRVIDGKVDLTEPWRNATYSELPNFKATVSRWVNEVVAQVSESKPLASLFESLTSGSILKHAPFNPQDLVSVYAHWSEVAASAQLDFIEFVTRDDFGNATSHLVRVDGDGNGRVLGYSLGLAPPNDSLNSSDDRYAEVRYLHPDYVTLSANAPAEVATDDLRDLAQRADDEQETDGVGSVPPQIPASN